MTAPSTLLLAAALSTGASAADTGSPFVVTAVQSPASSGGIAVQVAVQTDSIRSDLANPTAANFSARVGTGTATVAGVRNVEAGGEGVHTVLAFDQSGSFKDHWSKAFAFADHFATSLPTNGTHTVRVVTFGVALVDHGTAKTTSDLRALLAKAKTEGPIQGFTRLRSFARDSADLAAYSQTVSADGARQVALFTDMGEESSQYSDREVIDHFRKTGVRLHLVSFISRGVTSADDLDAAKGLAEKANGLSLLATQPTKVEEGLVDIANAGKHLYWLDLSFCGVQPLDDAKSFKDDLTVQATGTSTWTANRVRFLQDATGDAAKPCSKTSPAPADAPADGGTAPATDGHSVWLVAALIPLGLVGLLGLLGLMAARQRRDEDRLPIQVAPMPLVSPPVDPSPQPAGVPVATPPPVLESVGPAYDGTDPFADELPETHLRIVRGPSDLQPYYRLHKSPFTVGSQRGEVDLVIDHRMVSGKHATFQLFQKGNVFVVDGESTNGTFVDGHRLEAGGRSQVLPGQVVELSRHVVLRISQPGRADAVDQDHPAQSSVKKRTQVALGPSPVPSRGGLPPAPPRAEPQRGRSARRRKTKTIISPVKPED